MKLIVIEVVQDGKIGYLASTCRLNLDAVVDHPLKATNYALPENARDLERDIQDIYIEGDDLYGRSAVKVQSAQVVEMTVVVQESARREARPIRKLPA